MNSETISQNFLQFSLLKILKFVFFFSDQPVTWVVIMVFWDPLFWIISTFDNFIHHRPLDSSWEVQQTKSHKKNLKYIWGSEWVLLFWIFSIHFKPKLTSNLNIFDCELLFPLLNNSPKNFTLLFYIENFFRFQHWIEHSNFR